MADTSTKIVLNKKKIRGAPKQINVKKERKRHRGNTTPFGTETEFYFVNKIAVRGFHAEYYTMKRG